MKNSVYIFVSKYVIIPNSTKITLASYFDIETYFHKPPIVPNDLQLNGWLAQWSCSDVERRALWGSIQAVFEKAGDMKRAHTALVQVLSTYSEEDAADGRGDAIK